MLVLLSDISADRQWIQFEAGYGAGAGAKVIPLAIRGFSFGKLPFPLAGFQGRGIGDFSGLLGDISAKTGLPITPPKIADYNGAIATAEAQVTYKKLKVSPFIERGKEPCLYFELENIGNVDLDLIGFELKAPIFIRSSNWVIYDAAEHANTSHISINGSRYQHFTIWSNAGSQVSSLPPTLTPSMGPRWLHRPRLVFHPDLSFPEQNLRIYYQVHVRGHATTEESTSFAEAPVR